LGVLLGGIIHDMDFGPLWVFFFFLAFLNGKMKRFFGLELAGTFRRRGGAGIS
jgi:hypothetical protein